MYLINHLAYCIIISYNALQLGFCLYVTFLGITEETKYFQLKNIKMNNLIFRLKSSCRSL